MRGPHAAAAEHQGEKSETKELPPSTWVNDQKQFVLDLNAISRLTDDVCGTEGLPDHHHIWTETRRSQLVQAWRTLVFKPRPCVYRLWCVHD